MTRTETIGAWATATQPDLEAAIVSFKAEFPGWWYSLGECEKSCDASCAPTRESEDIALIDLDERFDSGFHVQLSLQVLRKHKEAGK